MTFLYVLKFHLESSIDHGDQTIYFSVFQRARLLFLSSLLILVIYTLTIHMINIQHLLK